MKIYGKSEKVVYKIDENEKIINKISQIKRNKNGKEIIKIFEGGKDIKSFSKFYEKKIENIDNIDELLKSIYDFYKIIGLLFKKKGNYDFKISIPKQLGELINNQNQLGIIKYIICGDNPGKTEYDNGIGFNPDGTSGKILNTVLESNNIKREDILFFNKTFIHTNTTNLLSKLNKDIVKMTINFNKNVLIKMSEFIGKKTIMLGGYNLSIFKNVFEELKENKNFSIVPHPSMYKMFQSNKHIPNYKEKITKFVKKYPKYVTAKSNNDNIFISFKKIIESKDKNKILKDFFNEVIIG